jgi:hypothetical protein
VTPFHFVKLIPIVTTNGKMITSKNITRPGRRNMPYPPSSELPLLFAALDVTQLPPHTRRTSVA